MAGRVVAACHTSLAAPRVAKTDPRLVAYADIDEANNSIGLAIALGAPGPGVREILTRVQNELFDVGADLCNPVVPDPEFPPLRIDQAAVDRLERDCDRYNRDLPSLRSFILPEAPSAVPCCTSPGRSCAGPNGPPGPRWTPTGKRPTR